MLFKRYGFYGGRKLSIDYINDGRVPYDALGMRQRNGLIDMATEYLDLANQITEVAVVQMLSLV
jgi:hypothetical protein